jgi:phosphatidylserine decarboxylase
MKSEQLQYVDRRTGQIETDPIYASSFLDLCYNTRIGWFLTRQLLCRTFISRAYGWYYKRRWTRHKIQGFVRKLDIETSDCLQALSTYRSFNDFIVRRIDLRSRPIDPDENTCVSPADGRVWVEPVVTLDRLFKIKSATFQLGSFLQDASLATAYDGGTLFVFRLYLGDYHHFHFPDSGTPQNTRSLPGQYLAVTPYSHRWFTPYFAANHRHLTLFDSRHFGRMVLVEVGAFTVGSIRQCFRSGECIRKGAHKGFFELGGSIVALLFSKGCIEVDDDLLANSGKGLETYLRMGESIGRIPNR